MRDSVQDGVFATSASDRVSTYQTGLIPMPSPWKNEPKGSGVTRKHRWRVAEGGHRRPPTCATFLEIGPLRCSVARVGYETQ